MLSAYSNDGGLAEGSHSRSKVVKFDQSVDKVVPSSSSLSKPSIDKAKEDLKWHLADQPKASIGIVIIIIIIIIITIISLSISKTRRHPCTGFLSL